MVEDYYNIMCMSMIIFLVFTVIRWLHHGTMRYPFTPDATRRPVACGYNRCLPFLEGPSITDNIVYLLHMVLKYSDIGRRVPTVRSCGSSSHVVFYKIMVGHAVWYLLLWRRVYIVVSSGRRSVIFSHRPLVLRERIFIPYANRDKSTTLF